MQVKSQPGEGDVLAAQVKSQPEEGSLPSKSVGCASQRPACRRNLLSRRSAGCVPSRPASLNKSVSVKISFKISVKFSVKCNSVQINLKIKIKKMKSEINSVNQSIRAPQLLIAPPRRDESKISYYEFLSSSSCV